MSIYKLPGSAIQANTISVTQLQTTVVTQIQSGASGGPKVKSLIYPGNDTAANSTGGQTVYITGSGFAANAQVLVNGAAVPSQSFISASNISFSTPALSTGTYPVYVINPEDGGTAILYPGLLISGEPTWVTGASLPSVDASSAWSISLSASGDTPITYALAAGNTLPSGITLAANGLISGTISSPPESDTQYTFSVVASDAQNQDSTRQFSITTSTGEGVLFANNALLIRADGTNNGNNHQFLDSSNNNFAITRYGNATQGSFSPFSQTGWSAYFDRNGDTLTIADNAALEIGSGDFTFEAWIYLTAFSGTYGGSFYGIGICGKDSESTRSYTFQIIAPNSSSYTALSVGLFAGSYVSTSANHNFQLNRWYHVAAARQSGTIRLFVDGVLIGSGTNTTVTNNGSQPFCIGAGGLYTGFEYFFPGYISNFRFVNGTAVYTSNFTPSTTPLTSIANTSVLTCQNNRFIDNSNNNFTITRNGDVSIQPFSPFAPTAAYSTANVGGSGYFDGTGDYLSWSGTTFSGDLTIECWLYKTAVDSNGYTILFHNTNTAINHQFQFDGGSTPGSISLVLSGSTVIPASGTAIITNSWSHLAWVRQGSTFRAYVNGIQQGTGTSSASFNINLIGQYHFGGNDINGYISGLRMINGTCLYPDGTTFTPPTSPPTNIANTSLLLNFTNAQIFDQTAKNVLETVGDAKVSTSVYKYGTGSIAFDGTGDNITIPSSPNLDFGTGDFTIELWINFSALSTNRLILDKWASGNANSWQLYWRASGTSITFLVGASTVLLQDPSTSRITTNTWYHIAVTRSGSTNRLFIDGTQVASATDSTNLTNTNRLCIGEQLSTLTNDFSGYIDDLRITKGYARYTSNFTPPASALKDK